MRRRNEQEQQDKPKPKRKRPPRPVVKDRISGESYEVDSSEEADMYEWCMVLCENGYLEPWTKDSPAYHPETFLLSGQVDMETLSGTKKTFARGHGYSPDFKITPTEKFRSTFPELSGKLFAASGRKDVYVDVKGRFSDFNGGRIFTINQKWVFKEHGIPVCKIVPDLVFAETFVPDALLYTPKTKKFREKYRNMKRISDIEKS